MIGMDRHTGAPLEGQDHLAQSIADILTTPIGTRVLRRDYGSRVPDLIDAPLNGQTIVQVYAATADALDKWEPRIRLDRVTLDDAADGKVTLRLEGRLRDPAKDAGTEVTGRDHWVLPVVLGGAVQAGVQ